MNTIFFIQNIFMKWHMAYSDRPHHPKDLIFWYHCHFGLCMSKAHNPCLNERHDTDSTTHVPNKHALHFLGRWLFLWMLFGIPNTWSFFFVFNNLPFQHHWHISRCLSSSSLSHRHCNKTILKHQFVGFYLSHEEYRRKCTTTVPLFTVRVQSW